MKLPPFTLVYRPPLPGEKSKTSGFGRAIPPQRLPGKPDALKLQTDPPSQYAIVQVQRFGNLAPLAARSITLSRSSKGPEQARRVLRVGFCDMGARIGMLPKIISILNKVQEPFVFFEAHAAVPVGVAATPQRVLRWFEILLKRPKGGLSPKDRRELGLNIITDDLYEPTEQIRRGLELDYLIGLTPYMIAFVEDGEPHWNYFVWWQKRVVLASTYELREFAMKAQCPFEVAVAAVALSGFLAQINPRVEFHENTGCMFDFNEDRSTIVRNLKDLKIEEACMKKILLKYRIAVTSLLDVLRQFKGS